jgi:hypothetical protein
VNAPESCASRRSLRSGGFPFVSAEHAAAPRKRGFMLFRLQPPVEAKQLLNQTRPHSPPNEGANGLTASGRDLPEGGPLRRTLKADYYILLWMERRLICAHST